MYGNFSLYPYAKAGATCSNKLVDRPYGSVTEYQLPLYLTEKDNGSLELDPDVTVYTLWIGTNDNGAGGILTGDQTPGVTLVDTITCAMDWVKTLYTSGARNFVFQNVRLLSRCRSRKCANERLGLSDAASAADGHVFCRLVPEWLLDCTAEHDRVERVHDRNHQHRQQPVCHHAPIDATNTRGCSPRYVHTIALLHERH